MRPVISIQHIGKAYRIGQEQKGRASFKDVLVDTIKSPLTRLRKFNENWDDDAPDVFWALKDINFEVNEGEVVGVVGRNGAGKSTLLKVLSRITEPTTGKAVLRGRCSSLLEVGTGFHPELTGRENIYLNGAILGMKQAEIKRKFDQIVEFSEVGKFLDTPVKRYSSGMYVRLAFSVAAHLESEIMIVDEVLAVGDAAFQKKCLGKMSDVMKQGRTILFVSHSMDSVSALCTSVVVVKKGRVDGKVSTEDGVREYLSLFGGQGAELPLAERPRIQKQKRDPVFVGLRTYVDGQETAVVPSNSPVTFEIDLANFGDCPGNLTCGLALYSQRGQRVVLLHTEYNQNLTFRGASRKTLVCRAPALPLTPGGYIVELVLADGYSEIERVEQAGTVEVVFADVFGTGKLPSYKQSVLALPATWEER